MGRRVGLYATVMVVASSLLWLLLVMGIVPGSAQAYRGSAVSVQVAATVNPQATPTTGQPAQQGNSVQNEQVPSWVTLSLLLLGGAILLAVLGLILWFGGLLSWHRQPQPAGWRYEVLLALLAALAAVAGLAAQVFAAFNTFPIWVPIALLALAVVLALAGAVVRLQSTQLEKKRIWARQVRELLNEFPGTDGLLPRISALSPYRLGVTPSRYGSEEQRGDDPYVRRVIDAALDQALHSKHFVLVVGDSKAGKSRTAYEAATRLQRVGRSYNPRVIVPKSTHLLEQLLNLDPPLNLQPEPALLWLDDLTESALAALTPALLDRLTKQMIMLGTLTAQRHNRVMDSDSDISRDARMALQRATVVRLEAVLTNEERVEAEQKYPEERFEAGIGEQLVAVDQLTSRYDDARGGTHPHGWAVVQAAIDWTRMDVGRPIRQLELLALCPLYLAQVRAYVRHDDADHEEALRWACQPVASHIALLKELSSDRDELSYEPFDYLVAAADGQDGRLPQPILDPAWDKVLVLVSPSEAFNTSSSAYLRQLPLRAQKILVSLGAEHPEEAPLAALSLAVLLKEQGNLEEAKAAFQQAIDSGHAKAAPTAAVELGVLLKEQGNLEEAKAAFQGAIDSGDADAAPKALGGLGLLLEEQGDLEEAKMAYQQAIDTGDADEAPRAAFNLGLLLEEQGDLEEAKMAYQQAIASGHIDAAPRAAFNLGILLSEQGDLRGAKAAYQQAIASGHIDAAPRAALNLGVLLEKQGDLGRAKAAYQQAIASGHIDEAPGALVNLGTLLEEEGDLGGAKAAFQQAIASGHIDAASRALVNLGLLLEEQGDLEEARMAYQQAIDSGHTDEAPRAAFSLGLLLEKQGNLEEAKMAYQRAIDSGHTDEAPGALVNLGVLLEKQGNLEEAEAAFQQAIASGHTEDALIALVGLGLLLSEQGDLEGAKAAYQRVITSGDAVLAPVAAFNLGVLLEEQGNLEEAKAAYQQAIASGHAVAAPIATRNLEQLLERTPPPAAS
jgi:tetratricopeptide (TPR) repeat protein